MVRILKILFLSKGGMKVSLLPFLITVFFTGECISSWAPSSGEGGTSSLHSRFAPPRMGFKLGFEFQETSGLCPWALREQAIQKTPLFKVVERVPAGRKPVSLWHLVIDTTDIEFVTEPFSDAEELKLRNSMETLTNAFEILRELFVPRERVTFDEWTDAIQDRLGGGFLLAYYSRYKDVRDREMLRSPGWRPSFAPQATIQHPLEWAIPLYFGLFGFDSRYMIILSTSLPVRDLLMESQKEADNTRFRQVIDIYKKKITGLVFLHALTFVQMTDFGEKSDTELLGETLRCLGGCHQVDAKMKLALMSRRPFSSMFREITLGTSLRTSYANYFTQAMSRNSGFTFSERISANFGKTNYAEQFFVEATGNPRDLSDLLPLFDDAFRDDNRDVLTDLLTQGVVSTTMMRNLRPDITFLDSRSTTTIDGVDFIIENRLPVRGSNQMPRNIDFAI